MYIFLLLYIVLNTAGLILLKKSLVMVKVGLNLAVFASLLMNWKFVAGFLLYLCSFLLWLFLLSKNEISSIYPVVVGSAYAAIVITSVVFMGEHLSLYKMIGISLIFMGILFIFK